MKIPHLAILPLVSSAAFATAQAAPASPFAAPATLQPTMHFDPKHPCALPTICESFGASTAQVALPFNLRPTQNPAFEVRPGLLASNLGAPGIPPTCYKVRVYEYTRTYPNTDQVQWTGTSTCQPASSFHMKSATLQLRPGIAD